MNEHKNRTLIGRRTMLALIGGAGLGATLPAGLAEEHVGMRAQLDADLVRLAGFGILRSGSSGDEACGEWMEHRLEAAGFRVEQQGFQVPWFKADTTTLTIDGNSLPVWPQPIVSQTGADGLIAKLRIYSTQDDLAALNGAIAIIDLPYARHSSLLQTAISSRIKKAESAGAAAIVLVTTGPTGDPILLNTPADTPVANVPLCVMGPSMAGPVFEAASEDSNACLKITGDSGERPARNIIGWRDGDGPAIVISTPRSGWFTCIGERGPGIVSFLKLAETVPQIAGDRPVLMVATSGHEYENLGAHHFLDEKAPSSPDVGLWVHLGAGFAARNWHQTAGELGPLSSADPQRFLLGSKALLPVLREGFRGQNGLNRPYPLQDNAAGELGAVAKRGYSPLFGLLGAHRFHHSPNDDLRMTSGQLVAPVVSALEAVLRELL